MHPWDFPSVFHVGAGASINFSQLSVRSRYLPSTFHLVEGLCANFLFAAGPSVDFHDLLCVHGTFFKLSAQPQNFCQLLPTLRASTGLSINFLCVHGTVWQLPSTFCVSVGPSKKGLCSRGSSINFPCNHGTSISFPCVHGTFHQLSVCP